MYVKTWKKNFAGWSFDTSAEEAELLSTTHSQIICAQTFKKKTWRSNYFFFNFWKWKKLVSTLYEPDNILTTPGGVTFEIKKPVSHSAPKNQPVTTPRGVWSPKVTPTQATFHTKKRIFFGPAPSAPGHFSSAPSAPTPPPGGGPGPKTTHPLSKKPVTHPPGEGCAPP